MRICESLSHGFFQTLLFFLLVLAIGCSTGSRPVDEEPSIEITHAPNAININTASKEELEKLPYVGEKLAALIVEHRERVGLFRKPEHLMLIPGISDKRFRKIRPMVNVE